MNTARINVILSIEFLVCGKDQEGEKLNPEGLANGI
jgi:hypothetical protein